jgi:hypothetical protein
VVVVALEMLAQRLAELVAQVVVAQVVALIQITEQMVMQTKVLVVVLPHLHLEHMFQEMVDLELLFLNT